MLVKPEWLEVKRTEAVEIIVEGVDLLDQAYHPFEQFYLNYHTKFLYSLFNIFILDLFPQTLEHAIGTWYH